MSLDKPPIEEKIRYGFFSADKSKMVNCVPASAEDQHIEAPMYANNSPFINHKAGFVVKINFSAPALQFQADLSVAHRFAPIRIFGIFFTVFIQRNRIDDTEGCYTEIYENGRVRRGARRNKILPKLCPPRLNISKRFQTKPKVG